MPDEAAAEAILLAEVLTTGSAVANYRGHEEVSAADLIDGLAILLEEKTLDDLGRALSPLVRRGSGRGGATAGVRALAQRWYAALGEDARASLDAETLTRLRAELEVLRLEEQTQGGAPPAAPAGH